MNDAVAARFWGEVVVPHPAPGDAQVEREAQLLEQFAAATTSS